MNLIVDNPHICEPVAEGKHARRLYECDLAELRRYNHRKLQELDNLINAIAFDVLMRMVNQK